LLVVIAIAVFILGMAIFIAQKGFLQTGQPEADITRQNEGTESGTLPVPQP